MQLKPQRKITLPGTWVFPESITFKDARRCPSEALANLGGRRATHD
jgi:hypothetical protein